MSLRRCPNHQVTSREYRAVAPIEVRPGVWRCLPCAARERVLALNVPALKTRTVAPGVVMAVVP